MGESCLLENRRLPKASVADGAPFDGVSVEDAPAVLDVGLHADEKHFQPVVVVSHHFLKLAQHVYALVVP